jgi:aminoglycoside phosphotransferase family enzyme/predicted kinase
MNRDAWIAAGHTGVTDPTPQAGAPRPVRAGAERRAADTLPTLIRALLDPAAYPDPRPADVELRQTHISYVLLAGERVYKIKKPVALGFLDYSTPRRRAYYCRREVELNRRFAPAVYVGVEPITRQRGAVRLGGSGRVLERAVVMRRLPAAGMLTELLATGAATPGLLAHIARRVAACHTTAASGPRVARYGVPGAVRRSVESNLARCAPFVGRTLPAAAYRHLRTWTAAFLRAHRGLLRRRVLEGRIRDAHGDLHAASICVVSGPAWRQGSLVAWTPADPPEVVLFDCIEFSARLRCTDVAAEVAFLAMDLDHYGRADLRDAFIAAYVAASGDVELPVLLPFYQSYRATVRGLVASIAADEGSFDAAGRAAQRALARSYFDLAYHAYAGGAPRPLLLLLGGLPASGKSTLARELAGRLALVPLNSDVVRKQQAGLAPWARGPAGYGAGLYTTRATDATYEALLDAARTWLERGVSVALDASFRRADHRRAAVAFAKALDVPWLAVECVCAPETARARLDARAADTRAASDADWSIYQRLAAEWEPWVEVRRERYRRVDTARSLDAAVAAVLGAVRRLPRPGTGRHSSD